ncbi:hypothetical protein C0992_001925 [Termitomyces sp. T32_za158]|nr:hypothetical protein C0992_001925 [Termitomyces sp. T32_za158]
MTKTIPQTPRRSKRGQPLVALSQEANSLYRAWCGKPLYVRPINVDLDLDRDDIDAEEDDTDEEDNEFETVFYSAMKMQKRCTAVRRRASSSKEAEEEFTTYHTGDTVLVETSGDSSGHKRPSIAVIIAMWEIRKKGSRETDPAKMRVRLQWFLRPTELPPYGLKREHTKVNLLLGILVLKLRI